MARFTPRTGHRLALRCYWMARPSGAALDELGSNWERVIADAKSVVGSCPSQIGLKTLMSDEISHIKTHLKKLVGTQHPFLETAKRLVYSGREGVIQTRGLVVLLVAKAAMSSTGSGDLTPSQRMIAEMTELIYSAYLVHKSVIDMSNPSPDEPKSVKDLRFGNKMSILSGDFLLSSVLRGLGEMRNTKVVELMSTAISQYTEGQFLIATESHLPEANASKNYWKERNFLQTASLQANSCQSALAVTSSDDTVQEYAYEFGRSFGLAWQAYIEASFFLHPFKSGGLFSKGAPSFDLMTAPILLYIESTGTTLDEFRSEQDGVVNYDYGKLHEMIRNSCGMEESRQLIIDYCNRTTKVLENFQPSQSVTALTNIINVMKEL